jgi:NADH dehydrogenase FAD-containing subunit
VEVRTNAIAEPIDPFGVTVGGAHIPARTVLWAAGVIASAAGKWLKAAVDRVGRVKVNPDLSVPGHPQIFVVGDAVYSESWAGKPMPGLAPAAKQSGAYAALVTKKRLEGKPAPSPFRYRHRGSLATIGRKAAVADLRWIRLAGVLAWWFWGAMQGALHRGSFFGSDSKSVQLRFLLHAAHSSRASRRSIFARPYI